MTLAEMATKLTDRERMMVNLVDSMKRTDNNAFDVPWMPSFGNRIKYWASKWLLKGESPFDWVINKCTETDDLEPEERSKAINECLIMERLFNR